MKLNSKKALFIEKWNNIVYIKIRNKISRRYLTLIIIFLIIITLFIGSLPSNIIESFFINSFSNITLKIRGTGNNNVFSSDINFEQSSYPNIIYINDERQDVIKSIYIFNQTENYIILIWNSTFRFCSYMFYECSNITEMDLSNFDSSEVIQMDYMFFGCLFLTSLNLSNFDTSKVEVMNGMFSGCSSLTSLDLSNFNTSQVTDMPNMFSGCSSLTYLDLSSFNTSQVTDMYGMFEDCSSLSSLNLSNFDTPKVYDISYFLSGCENLEYINLKYFTDISFLLLICLMQSQIMLLFV